MRLTIKRDWNQWTEDWTDRLWCKLLREGEGTTRAEAEYIVQTAQALIRGRACGWTKPEHVMEDLKNLEDWMYDKLGIGEDQRAEYWIVPAIVGSAIDWRTRANLRK